IYGMVTLNQTMISAIASIGNFIMNHKITPVSKEFDAMITTITNTLKITCSILDQGKTELRILESPIENAEEKLLEKYKQLSDLRDEDISKGNTKLEIDKLHELQEAYLISNQLAWLKSLSGNLKST